MRAIGWFAGLSLVAFALIGGVLGATAFRAPAEHRALVASALVAWVVQLATFAVIRVAGPRAFMKAWGLGVTMRFVTLGLYALLAVRLFALPAAAALLGLACFFFVSTLIETRLLSV